MTNKLHILTWGCQMNEYDSAKMAEVLEASHGVTLTDDPEQADVLLLNTCSVREKAQEKVFSELGRWREWKQARPGRVIGVGGCVASQESEALVRRTPYVDMVFGPQTLHRLPALLDRVRDGEVPVVDVSFPEIEKFDRLPDPRAEGPVAFVSIMEGCSKYCSFCVVPYTRGEEVSRPFDDVLAECALLARQGVREITLLGQNVNGYRGPMADGTAADLALLLRYLATLDGVARLRFTTSHPLEFGDRLIDAFGAIDKLAGYLHLPVQSGSDRILSLMKRGHTVLEYKQKIRALRERRPTLSLSTDFIVGYPGESEADFEATLRLIEDVRFDQAFSFIYSPRPGTPAAALADSTPAADKHVRLNRLQRRIRELGQGYVEAMRGSVQEVLVEKPSVKRPKNEVAGRTECNRWVNFPASEALIGQMAKVRITGALSNSLRGELVEPERGSRESYAA